MLCVEYMIGDVGRECVVDVVVVEVGVVVVSDHVEWVVGAVDDCEVECVFVEVVDCCVVDV